MHLCEWDMKCIGVCDVLAIGCSEFIQGRHTCNTNIPLAQIVQEKSCQVEFRP